jgi:hypothetical protein
MLQPGMAIQAPAGISTNKMKNRVVIRLLSQGSAAAGVAGTDVTAGQQEEEAKPCHDDLVRHPGNTELHCMSSCIVTAAFYSIYPTPQLAQSM